MLVRLPVNGTMQRRRVRHILQNNLGNVLFLASLVNAGFRCMLAGLLH